MTASASGTPAVPSDPAGLTRHIERHYHARHRRQLPELAAMAARVEALHADASQVPTGLSLLLQGLIGELDMHMTKEELILFPAMRSGGRGVEHPIAVMRADHADHAAVLDRMRALTGGFAAPEGACGAWRTLCAGLRDFAADLEEHVRLENEVLFPVFEGHRGGGA